MGGDDSYGVYKKGILSYIYGALLFFGALIGIITILVVEYKDLVKYGMP